MLDINKVENIFFLGIGGIGMSALARFFKHLGYNISGYDAVDSDITRALRSQGIEVFHTDSREHVKNFDPQDTLVVWTPAIKQSEILSFFKDKNFKIYKRAKILGELVNNHKLIAVAGTHGKTTTSALLTHILFRAGQLKAGFVGGIMLDYASNLVLGSKQDGYIVVEADEYDRSFLNLFPTVEVITAVDPDHLDIYGNYQNVKQAFGQFAAQLREGGFIVKNCAVDLELEQSSYLYGFEQECSFRVVQSRYEDGLLKARLALEEKEIDFDFVLPGKANLSNALAAATASYKLGVEPEIIAEALSDFSGIERRFEVKYKSENQVIIDDYAHHPRELEALLDSAKSMFPNRELTILFQPHLYTRTRDFAGEFADVLRKFDRVFITDIYPAREAPIKGINAEMLAKLTGDKAVYLPKEQVAEFFANDDFEVLIFAGAGDVNLEIEKIKRLSK